MESNWTLYHLATPAKPAPQRYHDIHIYLTAKLYEYTNVTIFKTYSERWETYTEPPSFLLDEILSPEFIYFGSIVAVLIIGSLLLIDLAQTLIRRKLRSESDSTQTSTQTHKN